MGNINVKMEEKAFLRKNFPISFHYPLPSHQSQLDSHFLLDSNDGAEKKIMLGLGPSQSFDRTNPGWREKENPFRNKDMISIPKEKLIQ